MRSRDGSRVSSIVTEPLVRPSADPAPAATGRVAVVVVTHNAAPWIGPCLASLGASGTPLTTVWVVDNGSTDGTSQLVRARFPEARVIEAGANLGYGAAVNLALPSLSGEYVVVLNQDTISVEGWIERLVAALDANPAAGLATPKILLSSDPSVVNACGNNVHYTGVTTCRGYGTDGARWTSVHEVPAISGAAFAIRRLVVDRLGGFDPLFFMYLEDADLSLRAALGGFRTVCAPEATVLHDFEPTFADRKIFWLECHRMTILLRIFRFRTLVVLAPALVVTEWLVLGFAASHGRPALAAKVRAYGWILRSMTAIRASRRRAQRLRHVRDADLLEIVTPRFDVAELQGRVPRLVAALVNPFYSGWLDMVRRVVRW